MKGPRGTELAMAFREGQIKKWHTGGQELIDKTQKFNIWLKQK